MKTKDFSDVNVVVAERQKEFTNTPGYYNNEVGSFTYGSVFFLSGLRKL